MKANRKQQSVNDVLDTTIAYGLEVRGDISSEGDIWIDGEIEGNVTASSRVIVGDNGFVNGNISGHVIVVRGSVEGDITASESLSYEDTAHMRGDSHTPSLQVANGASIAGKIAMPEANTERVNENESSDTDDTE